MRRIWLCSAVGGFLLLGAVALAARTGFPPFLTMWGGQGSAPGLFGSPEQVAVEAPGVL
jgi:hypothetical protein